MRTELAGWLPLVICLIGALAYFVSAHQKVAELGRLTFWVGLLAWLLTGARLL